MIAPEDSSAPSARCYQAASVAVSLINRVSAPTRARRGRNLPRRGRRRAPILVEAVTSGRERLLALAGKRMGRQADDRHVARLGVASKKNSNKIVSNKRERKP